MNVDYSAAKAGMNNLTQALSEEYGPQGIRVNTVSPGPVRTAWWTEEGGAADIIAAQTGTDRDAVMDTVAPEMMKLTTGRLVDPQEVADAIALLVSPRSASTTGSDWVVDAGFLKSVRRRLSASRRRGLERGAPSRPVSRTVRGCARAPRRSHTGQVRWPRRTP